MGRINLIKNTRQFQELRARGLYLKVTLLGLLFLLVLVYAVILINTFLVQNQLEEVARQLTAQSNIQTVDAQNLAKTAKGTLKLKSIREVFLDTPEYYKQYQYLLEKIVEVKNFNINEFSLSKDQRVSLAITTDTLDELLTFIAQFDTPDVSKNFDVIQFSNISFSQKPSDTRFQASPSAQYQVTLELKFNDEFNEPIT